MFSWPLWTRVRTIPSKQLGQLWLRQRCTLSCTQIQSRWANRASTAATAHSDYNPQMAARDGASRPEHTLDIRLVVDTIPTLAWSSHPDGSVDFVNQRWREYTGLSAEESYGSGWKTAVHPDDLPSLAAKWEAPCDGAAARECELRLRRSDGVFRWFSLRREPQCSETGALLDGMEQRSTLKIESNPKRYSPLRTERSR